MPWLLAALNLSTTPVHRKTKKALCADVATIWAPTLPGLKIPPAILLPFCKNHSLRNSYSLPDSRVCFITLAAASTSCGLAGEVGVKIDFFAHEAIEVMDLYRAALEGEEVDLYP